VSKKSKSLVETKLPPRTSHLRPARVQTPSGSFQRPFQRTRSCSAAVRSLSPSVAWLLAGDTIFGCPFDIASMNVTPSLRCPVTESVGVQVPRWHAALQNLHATRAGACLTRLPWRRQGCRALRRRAELRDARPRPVWQQCAACCSDAGLEHGRNALSPGSSTSPGARLALLVACLQVSCIAEPGTAWQSWARAATMPVERPPAARQASS